MPGTEHLTISIRIATVVVPVAVYFLILGLLNSRRRPQLLTGWMDFALLIVALSPILILPTFGLLGVSILTAGLAALTVAAVVLLLGPPAGSWVVYNTSVRQVRRLLGSALDDAGIQAVETENGFDLTAADAGIEIGGFGLLRNVTIRLHGGDKALARAIEGHLAVRIGSVSAETSPMAMALLLVATCMLVAPLTLMAGQAWQIVRIITDLLP